MGIERSIDKRQRETGKEVSQVSLIVRTFSSQYLLLHVPCTDKYPDAILTFCRLLKIWMLS